MTTMVRLEGVSKSFTLHLRGGVVIDAVHDLSLTAKAGECVALGGPSGAGKSSALKMIYGNYRIDGGSVRIRHDGSEVEMAGADPRVIMAIRARTLGYVSQFLRVIPRVPAIDIVAEAAADRGGDREAARDEAARLLTLLNIPERLWALPPATFSGGEQQRVNVARGFAARRPVLLLDEPTASLDAANKQVVVDLITEKKQAGVAIIGIFHDAEIRSAVADDVVEIAAVSQKEAA
ncbi:phosphonate C-P lyase system protein PhnL [Hansschlegelia quercus]|uniref:Phosphonate C-P lyase system protein PhnL n=1 Tax=Hansschlegelia quercus TaxID=2528245 RepID=A0A4Q9GFZ2_9HYPH|nr:phosphonate C-P lyase system protein PhnL [Hansschlegelia quercus]TBN51786.1 phosphonate C-P lyase system protein PhnL [Hansschlegelia quercus]